VFGEDPKVFWEWVLRVQLLDAPPSMFEPIERPGDAGLKTRGEGKAEWVGGGDQEGALAKPGQDVDVLLVEGGQVDENLIHRGAKSAQEVMKDRGGKGALRGDCRKIENSLGGGAEKGLEDPGGKGSVKVPQSPQWALSPAELEKGVQGGGLGRKIDEGDSLVAGTGGEASGQGGQKRDSDTAFDSHEAQAVGGAHG
jgi:hypothetical protein